MNMEHLQAAIKCHEVASVAIVEQDPQQWEVWAYPHDGSRLEYELNRYGSVLKTARGETRLFKRAEYAVSYLLNLGFSGEVRIEPWKG